MQNVDATENILNKVLLGFFILGGVFVGLFIWGASSFMGDKFYSIQVENAKDVKLKIRTYRMAQPENKLVLDSVVLNPHDKFEIGTAHSCSKIDTRFIWFDAIEILDTADKPVVVKKDDLPEYLRTMEKADCSTYLIR